MRRIDIEAVAPARSAASICIDIDPALPGAELPSARPETVVLAALVDLRAASGAVSEGEPGPPGVLWGVDADAVAFVVLQSDREPVL